MQTKLRIGGLMFAASLLGVPPTYVAAKDATVRNAHTTSSNRPSRPLGMASWYGERHQGRKMADGKKFDRRKLTAASWTLPLGTTIRVVNLRNDRSVVVTVTDRGPARRLHRVLDLSEAAAQQLGYIDQGLTAVFYSQVAFIEPEQSIINHPLIAPSTDVIVAAAGELERVQ